MKYLALLLFLMSSSAALACDCGIIDERIIDRASTIFEGIPFSYSGGEDGSNIRYEFKVSKTWKGESVDTIIIEGLSPDLFCFVPSFTMGEKYIVFSYRGMTSTCTFNAELENSNIIGLLRYKYEKGFREKLGQHNRKRLNEQEAFYLNNKFRAERGRLDFREARVIFRNGKKRIRKKAYFAQWGGTIYRETLQVIHPKRRWLRGYEAVIQIDPIMN